MSAIVSIITSIFTFFASIFGLGTTTETPKEITYAPVPEEDWQEYWDDNTNYDLDGYSWHWEDGNWVLREFGSDEDVWITDEIILN